MLFFIRNKFGDSVDQNIVGIWVICEVYGVCSVLKVFLVVSTAFMLEVSIDG